MKYFWCSEHIHGEGVKMLGQCNPAAHEVLQVREFYVLLIDVAREVGKLL